MKIFYASGITFPSRPVNRLQILNTANAFAKQLGSNFVLGACSVDPQNAIYRGNLVNFGHYRSFKLGWRQISYVLKHPQDFVFGREPALVFVLMILNRFLFRLPIKFVFEAHDVQQGFRARYVYRHSSYIFCVSSGIAEDIKTMRPSCPVTVQRNGVDISINITDDKPKLRIQYSLPSEARIVTYVGSMGRLSWKGEDVLLSSREYVSVPDVHFVFAGVREESLQEFVSEFGDNHTTFLGILDAEDVAKVQALSDILVLPNKPNTIESKRYTSPIKMFEYMRSGVPILASDLPSIREVLSDQTATFFKAGDPQELAKGIKHIFEQSDKANEKALRAQREVEQYSWEHKVKNITTILSGMA